jgi:hypothetical protein
MLCSNDRNQSVLIENYMNIIKVSIAFQKVGLRPLIDIANNIFISTNVNIYNNYNIKCPDQHHTTEQK